MTTFSVQTSRHRRQTSSSRFYSFAAGILPHVIARTTRIPRRSLATVVRPTYFEPHDASRQVLGALPSSARVAGFSRLGREPGPRGSLARNPVPTLHLDAVSATPQGRASNRSHTHALSGLSPASETMFVRRATCSVVLKITTSCELAGVAGVASQTLVL